MQPIQQESGAVRALGALLPPAEATGDRWNIEFWEMLRPALEKLSGRALRKGASAAIRELTGVPNAIIPYKMPLTAQRGSIYLSQQ